MRPIFIIMDLADGDAVYSEANLCFSGAFIFFRSHRDAENNLKSWGGSKGKAHCRRTFAADPGQPEGQTSLAEECGHRGCRTRVGNYSHRREGDRVSIVGISQLFSAELFLDLRCTKRLTMICLLWMSLGTIEVRELCLIHRF